MTGHLDVPRQDCLSFPEWIRRNRAHTGRGMRQYEPARFGDLHGPRAGMIGYWTR